MHRWSRDAQLAGEQQQQQRPTLKPAASPGSADEQMCTANPTPSTNLQTAVGELEQALPGRSQPPCSSTS